MTRNVELLNEYEAAEILSISVHTLRRQRSERRGGVPFVRIGTRTIRYALADLERYVEQSRVDPRPGGER